MSGSKRNLSPPRHEFKLLRDELTIPMRDGTKLSADLYLPKGPGPWPVLLERTPYNKESSVEVMIESPMYYATRGYAVVIQDTRGRYRSEGEFYPFRDDGWGANRDGYDTIEWLAAQKWCDGRIGMIGGSYAGHTQYSLAPTRPPHLAALFARQSVPDYREGWVFRGGAFELGFKLRWSIQHTQLNLGRLVSSKADRERIDGVLGKALEELDSWYEYLPLIEMPLLKGLSDWYYDWLANANDGPHWWSVNVGHHHSDVDVPIYHLGGWFDIFQQGTLDNFMGVATRARSSRARQSQKLIIGPWCHGPTTMVPSKLGEFEFGPESARDFNDLRLPWYDYWLKDLDTGVMDEPPVSYFTMGANRWQTAQSWPPPGFVPVTHYFAPGPSGSADSLNDGRLIVDDPPGTAGADSYLYDPSDPIRTRGGSLLYPGDPGSGPYDQRPVETRCLTYTSEPLNRDVEVTGRVMAVLFAMSSAPDTDWVVRLSDVSPDGISRPVAEGIQRARYRDSQTAPSLLEPGKVYEFAVDLWSTSNVFLAGHRIRVTVTSSCFPRWDRNLNTGGPFGLESAGRPAVNTILRDRFRPSHIVLPVRRGAASLGPA